MTHFNGYVFIFGDGEIFQELRFALATFAIFRVSLKPSCQLVLCKYPHDKQTCSLRISSCELSSHLEVSVGFPQEAVKFEWFTRKHDAIRLNRDVQLPELFLLSFSPHHCDGTRKSGNFSCLEAKFHMRRDIGYHMAQTYV